MDSQDIKSILEAHINAKGELEDINFDASEATDYEVVLNFVEDIGKMREDMVLDLKPFYRSGSRKGIAAGNDFREVHFYFDVRSYAEEFYKDAYEFLKENFEGHVTIALIDYTGEQEKPVQTASVRTTANYEG